MIKIMLCVMLVVTSAYAAAPEATATGGGVTLRSATIELPSSDRVYPGGIEADALNANCIACHSADMVLNQPALTRATWQEEVTKMIKVYRAPANEADVPAIVDYLATNPGTK